MSQSRRSNSQPGGGRGHLLLSAVVLIVFAGCESGFGNRREGDPLVGIHSGPKAVAEAGGTSNPPAQPAAGPIPAMPSSYTTPGTAPVAGGETATSEDARNLRLTTDTVSPTSPSSTGAVRGTAPGIIVGNPEPALPNNTSNLARPPASGGVATPSPAPPPPGGAAANIRTYEEAQQFLKQHGVNWQRLSGDEGEWKFACGIPNPSNPRVNRTYQTSKAFPDYLSAIRDVIAGIEQESR